MKLSQQEKDARKEDLSENGCPGQSRLSLYLFQMAHPSCRGGTGDPGKRCPPTGHEKRYGTLYGPGQCVCGDGPEIDLAQSFLENTDLVTIRSFGPAVPSQKHKDSYRSRVPQHLSCMSPSFGIIFVKYRFRNRLSPLLEGQVAFQDQRGGHGVHGVFPLLPMVIVGGENIVRLYGSPALVPHGDGQAGLFF